MAALKKIEDRYLGDGVYASVEEGHYHVWLDLRGQDSATRIALDPSVRRNLEQLFRDMEDVETRAKAAIMSPEDPPCPDCGGKHGLCAQCASPMSCANRANDVCDQCPACGWKTGE